MLRDRTRSYCCHQVIARTGVIAAVQRFTRLDWLLLALLAAISTAVLWPKLDETRFHRDEARWIGNSAILGEWRDPFSDAWQDEGYRNQFNTIDETVRRRSQPPVAMYLIGLGLLVQGQDLPELSYWIMTQDNEWNSANGAMPSEEQLLAARRIDLVVTILTVLIIYVIGRRLTNRLGGLIGALLFAIHPLVIDTGTRAWSDPLLTLTLALAAWLAIRLTDDPGWLNTVGFGMALGLGASTKLSPLLLAAGIGAAGLLMVIVGDRMGDGVRRLGSRLAVSPVIAALTFVLVYPYLWVSPIRNTWRMFEFRSLSFDLQSESFPPAAVADRTDAFRRLGHELSTRFSAIGQVSEWLGHSPESWLRELDLILATAGLLILIGLAFRQGIVSPPTMTLVVIGGQSLLILLTIGVEYARYFLPIVLATTTLAGVTIGIVITVFAELSNGLRLAGRLEVQSSPDLTQVGSTSQAETRPWLW